MIHTIFFDEGNNTKNEFWLTNKSKNCGEVDGEYSTMPVPTPYVFMKRSAHSDNKVKEDPKNDILLILVLFLIMTDFISTEFLLLQT